jgi:hypothetical protein
VSAPPTGELDLALEPLAPIRLAPRDVALWLLATCAVGLAGSALLEGARLVAPAPLRPIALILFPVEAALYLLALHETRGPRLRAGGIALGLILAALLRLGLAAGLALIRFSPLAPAGFAHQFGLYYLRLWPAALNQMCAVAIFLWLIRDTLAPEPATEPARPVRVRAEGADPAENRRELLAALMARPEDEPAQPESPDPPEAVEAELSPPEEPVSSEPLLADDPRLAEPIRLVESDLDLDLEPPLALPVDPPDLPPTRYPSAEDTSTFPQVQGRLPLESDN